MIQNESVVNIADNTGAKVWKVIRIIKGSRARFAYIWDIVVIAVKSAMPWSNIEKWDVVRAVVVRSVKETWRPDWTYIRFSDNAVAIIDKEKNPKWKRIFWPVAKELRVKWFMKLANLAEEII